MSTDAKKQLLQVALNARWSYAATAAELFAQIDPDWKTKGPMRVLLSLGSEKLDELLKLPAFCGALEQAYQDLEQYLGRPQWLVRERPEAPPDLLVAYFCMEYGLSASVAIYSGGLGVLAGDWVKTMSDMGVPFVAMGLLYKEGYFRQQVRWGWQHEQYERQDPGEMGLELCRDENGSPILVTVDLTGQTLHAQIWRIQVGRVDLYLLDSDIDRNSPELRTVTDRLYGGDDEHRIRQEILLGIGGVRALRALGLKPTVYHMNEGHAGFLGLERIRELVQQGIGYDEAVKTVRESNVFTTHTPVPAGIDIFPGELMIRYFGSFAHQLGRSFNELFGLGHFPSQDGKFNMAAMGLRLAARANGVSSLHGEVSRQMFAPLYGVPVHRVPITGIVNGVHGPTWVSPEVDALYQEYISPNWAEADPETWQNIWNVPNDLLLKLRGTARAQLTQTAREHLRRELELVGSTDTEWTQQMLDPNILTIGFARRVATYKRLLLILSDPDRLRRLLLNQERPVQFVFAGKAHPKDDGGKLLLKQLVEFCLRNDVRHRIVFLPNYNIELAAALVQGCDVWMNNPTRPHEASGTSGEKSVLNGGLSFSVLDGWYDEMFDGRNGWAIGDRSNHTSDYDTAQSLYATLEQQIVPAFYDEGNKWAELMKYSIASLAPQVNMFRMGQRYVDELYLPTAIGQ